MLDAETEWYEPALTALKGMVILLRAPIIKKTAQSAVALLTAVGVFDTDIPKSTISELKED